MARLTCTHEADERAGPAVAFSPAPCRHPRGRVVPCGGRATSCAALQPKPGGARPPVDRPQPHSSRAAATCGSGSCWAPARRLAPTTRQSIRPRQRLGRWPHPPPPTFGPSAGELVHRHRRFVPARSFDLEVTLWAPTRLTSCIFHPGPEEAYERLRSTLWPARAPFHHLAALGSAHKPLQNSAFNDNLS